MSLPSVFKIPRWFDRALVNIHAGAAHNRHVKLLAELIWDRIAAVYKGSEAIRCLDIRCGEMAIISTIAKSHSKITWVGIDVNPLPDYMRSSSLWTRYERFNGTRIDMKTQSFDVGILTDVLNRLPTIKQLELLQEAARVCKVVIVKDHMEYGLISRLALMAMDLLGDQGRRVRAPRRYFSRHRFDSIVRVAGLKCQRIDVGIQLYGNLPLIRTLLRPKWQFIAVISQ